MSSSPRLLRVSYLQYLPALKRDVVFSSSSQSFILTYLSALKRDVGPSMPSHIGGNVKNVLEGGYLVDLVETCQFPLAQ
eukprot:scaffold12848_cov71-Skeletonema_dohrnii-CCMP3373.AAC.1